MATSDRPSGQAEQEQGRLLQRAATAAWDTVPDAGGPAGEGGPHPPDLEILGILGEGGMGVVYKARQASLGRLVALKVIRAGEYASPRDLARFRREAEATARLHHPNIVQVYQFGAQGGRPYLVLELVGGGSLAERLDGTPLPPQQAAQLAMALARGVQHAHERGILHRDLKPANVLLAEDGSPKIADFGIARPLEPGRAETATGAVIGSPSYMAPEQAEGKARALGPGVDIYALGAILYECLTGRPPFRGVTLLETLEQSRTLDPVRPSSLQPKVAHDLEAICLKCLEKEPDQRYSSARELADDLQRWLAGEPVRARSPTLLESLARTIRFQGAPDALRSRALPVLLMAPFPLAAHLALFLLLGEQPAYPLVCIVATVAAVVFMLSPMFLANLALLRSAPRLYRRFWVSATCARCMGWILAPAIVALARPGHSLAEFALVFPLWALSDGTFWFMAGTYAGVFIPVALAHYAAALLMTQALSFGPLLYGALASGGLAVLGWYLRSLGD